MAGKTAKVAQPAGTDWGYWNEQITQGLQRYSDFQTEGDNVIDRYRLEKSQRNEYWRDKYNILYSTTETMKPSLYAQTPKVEAQLRHKDRSNQTALMAVMLIEACTQYALEEVDFDGVLDNVLSDFLLPGMGQAWVRYDPQFRTIGEGADAYEDVAFEGLDVDYVNFKDFLTDDVRVWKDKRWLARRVYFGRKKATGRFGAEKAGKLQYTQSQTETAKPGTDNDKQAAIWEIWDRDNKEVLWYSSDVNEFLDRKPDPLNLKGFFPCPRPLRAVTTTNTFVPRAFYSQYKQQAETLDDITQRIRILTKALRVVGVYDSSQANLSKLLTGNDNRMVPVENWAAFASQNGLAGSVQYLPIKDIATVLGELYKQREIAKNEIYEITGFSDIQRGVSKASETLGAQEIKNQWASGRLKTLQKDVQRFCRDIIRIKAEIISEQFSDESLALYSGFEPPEVAPEEQQAAAQYAQASLTQAPGTLPPLPPTKRQQAMQTFKEVAALLRKEKTRCALIGIETDSTILPDEAAERKDRMEFLGAAGAFMQQAGPMAMQYPEMRGLLGSMLMFTIRTFRASRPIEKDFEEFSQHFANAPAMPPPGSKGEGGGSDPAAAQAQIATEQMKQQGEAQLQQNDLQLEKYKIDKQEETKRLKLQQDHTFEMEKLRLEFEKLKQGQDKLMLDANTVQRQEGRADDQHAHQQSMDYDNAGRADRELEVSQQQAQAVDKTD